MITLGVLVSGSGTNLQAILDAIAAKTLDARVAVVVSNVAGALEPCGCVRDQLGDKIPLIVDGGPTARSTATTIVDLSGGNIKQ